MVIERWGSANHWKKWIFRGKITYFIGFLERSCYYKLTISKYIELEPWDWFQIKKKIFFSFGKFFDHFFTFMKILINFPEFEVCMTKEFFFQINQNLLKYPNFLKFFDRIEIYDILSAIWDLPRGYSFFTLEIACK